MSSTKSDFDALLMDWLYHELDQAEAERFEDHLAMHPAARSEAESLKYTRAAFKNLEEAEPAHALSAILLREAALTASAKESWWSRGAAFLQPILVHPGLSAVATLILLCGVAGALYLREGGPTFAEPNAGLRAAPALVSTQEAARDPDEDATAPSRAMVESQGRGNAEADEDSFAVDLVGIEQEGAIAGAKRTLAEPESLRIVLAQVPIMDSEFRWEEAQHQNLKQAAQGKHCKEVGRIANDILDKNSRFYKARVERTKAAQNCRQDIASETRRRLAKSRQEPAANHAKAKQKDGAPPTLQEEAKNSTDVDVVDTP